MTEKSDTIHIIDEDWCTIDLETKLNKKIDSLQALVHQQSQLIHTLSDEIKMLKTDLHTAKHQNHSQNDRTHQLLEELKVLKQRELNLALRVHTPVPFTAIPNSFFTTQLVKDLKSPLFKSTVDKSLVDKSLAETTKPPVISL